MIRRKEYEEKISKWYRFEKNVMLFVLGLPGIGKTTLILEWAKSNNVQISYFNKKEYLTIKEIFSSKKFEDYDLKLINTLFGNKTLEHLLVFDGVEPGDPIISNIKNICEDSKFKFILISDFGKCVFDGISFQPVGYVSILDVKPLSFEEFCLQKVNSFALKQLNTELSNDSVPRLSNSDRFEYLWSSYKKYGGFPSVVNNLFTNGENSAKEQLKNLKIQLVNFIESHFKQNNLMLKILGNYSNTRSSIYQRFVFNDVSDYLTFQRAKNSLSRLEDFGLISVLPIKKNEQQFQYCDIFLTDVGLENIWGGENKSSSEHILFSCLNQHIINKGYNPFRYVSKEKIEMDFVFGISRTIFIEVKQKITYGRDSMEIRGRKLANEFNEQSFSSFVLVDSPYCSYEIGNNALFMPIWAYLLR